MGSFAGTTLRFSGQSYVRYRPLQAQNWQVHFYLRTLQPWALLMFTNETASIALKVSDSHVSGFHSTPNWEEGCCEGSY